MHFSLPAVPANAVQRTGHLLCSIKTLHCLIPVEGKKIFSWTYYFAMDNFAALFIFHFMGPVAAKLLQAFAV